MQGRKAFLEFLIPIGILVVGTALIVLTDLDLAVERLFYRQHTGWEGLHTPTCNILFKFGIIPGFVLAGGALMAFVTSLFSAPQRRFRKPALFLLLVCLIGPGLIVNTLFKDHWGRPRPIHLQMFGGVERAPYHQIWQPGISGEGKSFPCGHASIAFYLFTPYFVLRRRDPAKARGFLALGLAYGIFMGIARMAMGGHFISDVLWSGGIVYLVGLVLSYLMKLDEDPLQLSNS